MLNIILDYEDNMYHVKISVKNLAQSTKFEKKKTSRSRKEKNEFIEAHKQIIVLGSIRKISGVKYTKNRKLFGYYISYCFDACVKILQNEHKNL
jgi:hypothetical protein